MRSSDSVFPWALISRYATINFTESINYRSLRQSILQKLFRRSEITVKERLSHNLFRLENS
jgi:hypothetical protein